MLTICRSLLMVLISVTITCAVTCAVAQDRGSRDADRNNSHDDARQRASERHEPNGPGVLALLPGDSVTEHSIDLPSGKLAYTATAGTFALFDQSGERSAQIFYTAFVTKSANAAARPVTGHLAAVHRPRFDRSDRHGLEPRGQAGRRPRLLVRP